MATYVKYKRYNGSAWVEYVFPPGPHNHTGEEISDSSTVYYIQGNTSGTAGTWTGSNAGITAYNVGLTIAFKVGINGGASTTTLNINGLGAVTCLINTSNLTTHFAVNTVIILVYDGANFRTFDYNTNTTYSELPESEIDGGTASTLRTMTGRRAKYAVNNHYSLGAIESRNSETIRFWHGTQAQYDAISTKDSNTIYFVS